MKLRYLFSIILSSVLLLSGCAREEELGTLDTIKLSDTFLTIPEAGGEVVLTIDATEAWAIKADDNWPDVVKYKTNDKGEKEESSRTPSWLTLTNGSMSGEAGKTELTFSAEATSGGREVEIMIVCGGYSQFVKFRQGSMTAVEATCAEVNAGPDGKTYRVRGIVTSIINTLYGNWYLADSTGEIYIYGTLDKDGAEKKFASWGLEAGDEIIVEGPKTTYGSTVELVNVTVIEIKKSLIKVVSPAVTVAKDGGELEVKVAYKGSGAFPSVPEEYKGWVSMTDMKFKAGEPSKLEPNPADTALVKFNVLANKGGNREGMIVFTSEMTDEDGKLLSSSVNYTFSQEGAIIETTVAEIKAAEDGATLYKVTGYVSSIASETWGNLYIKDYTGEVYVYGTLDAEGAPMNFASLGIKAGDIVTVVGPKTSYKGSPQMANVTVEKHVAVADKTVEDFLAAPDASDVYYRLTGTMQNIRLNTDGTQNIYGNFDIVDETGSVYVYGLLSGWGGPSKQFQSLGLKEGDKVTIVGVRSTFKETAQVASAFYVSHEAGSVDEGGEEGGEESGEEGGETAEITLAAEDMVKQEGVGFTGTINEALAYKLGTNSKEQTLTITAADYKTISFYGAGWTTGTNVINLTNGTIDGAESVTLVNSSAVNGTDVNAEGFNVTVENPVKYTITVTDSSADVVLSIKRGAVWGFTATK